MVYCIQNLVSPHCVILNPQINVQDLETKLFTEVKKNKEHTSEMEQLRNDITQHK